MKHEYNIGDHVIVEESNIEWMHSYAGKTGTIKNVHNNSSGYNYLVQMDKGSTVWCKIRCLAELDKKIVITTDGKTTTAKLYEDGKSVKTATAKCAPEDTFDFGVGAKLALERLTATEKPTEEPPK